MSPVPILYWLRAVCSQLIVWHHLAFYGPVSDHAYVVAPGLFDWLVDYARMAVQVFFVVGGFVTARKLSQPQRWTLQTLGREVFNRYRRIGIPYLAALALAIVANGLARRAMDHESISAPPSMTQLLAHAALLQDVFDYEPLTAGIWYLAIDFQLGLLVLLALALCQKIRGFDEADPAAGFRAAQWVYWPLAAFSLGWLNRQMEFDHCAPYFFGSYFGGMVVAWTLDKRLPQGALAAYAVLVAGALAIDWRPRLVVALATVLAIYAAEVTQTRRGAWASRLRGLVHFWGERSYSLFLVHFPVCLVVTAWIADYVIDRPHAALGVLVLEYVLSLLAAVAFYRYIERRATGTKRPSAPRPAQSGTLVAGPLVAGTQAAH